MTVKLFEIRDRGTCISALAVRLNGAHTESERWLLARAGFGAAEADQAAYVLLLNLVGSSGHFSCDPYEWPGSARTMPVAQGYINEHFDDLASGSIVDVSFILGETAAPVTSDAQYVSEGSER